MKDEFRSQEDLSVAAIGYIPPIWLFLLLFHRWRANYYTRYHLVHSALLSGALLGSLLLTGWLTYWSAGWTGYHFGLFLLTGSVITLTLLTGFGMIAYCGLSAYRGRYTVLPLLTRIYYLLLAQRVIKKDNFYDSRQITQMRPYLKPLDPSDPASPSELK